MTAAHIVANFEDPLEALNLLACYGSDFSILDNAGELPLHHAIRASGSDKVITFLQQYGGPMSDEDDAESPRELARSVGEERILHCLDRGVLRLSHSDGYSILGDDDEGVPELCSLHSDIRMLWKSVSAYNWAKSHLYRFFFSSCKTLASFLSLVCAQFHRIAYRQSLCRWHVLLAVSHVVKILSKF